MAAVNGESMLHQTKEKSQVWTHDLDLELLQNVQTQLESLEGKKGVYVKDIPWGKVAFGEFDEEAVHKRWTLITSKVRKLRTAKEILEDAKVMVAAKTEVRNSRKRKINKDSDLPKPPLSSYFIFCERKRQRMKEKHAELSGKELTSKLGKKWNKLTDEKKKKYQDIFLEGKKKYEEEMTQYYMNKFPDSKPPRTAFDLWSKKKQKEIKQERPDISEKKLKKKLNKYWENFENEDKEEWLQKSALEVKEFIKQMKKRGVENNKGNQG